MNNPLSRNLTPKIISIFFALFMWTYVMSIINPTERVHFYDVPVRLLNEDLLAQQELVIKNGGEQSVRVTLVGRRDEVYSISKSDILITADVSGYREGINSIPLENNVFPNIDIEISPKIVRIELEEIIRVQREVSLSISGDPQANHVLNELQFQPSVVTVEGPESYVNAVDRVEATLDVNGASENISTSLPLKAVNSRGNVVSGVELKTTYVEVYLPIDEIKTVPVRNQIQAEAAEGYMITSITALPEQVTLKGQKEVMAAVTQIETVLVNLGELTESVTQPLELVLPEGVSRINEEEISLNIDVQPTVTEELTLDENNISYFGLESGLSIDTALEDEAEIQLTIEGAADVLEGIDISDIELVFEVSGLTEGQHQVVPRLIIRGIAQDLIKNYELNPSSFTVNIAEGT